MDAADRQTATRQSPARGSAGVAGGGPHQTVARTAACTGDVPCSAAEASWRRNVRKLYLKTEGGGQREQGSVKKPEKWWGVTRCATVRCRGNTTIAQPPLAHLRHGGDRASKAGAPRALKMIFRFNDLTRATWCRCLVFQLNRFAASTSLALFGSLSSIRTHPMSLNVNLWR